MLVLPPRFNHDSSSSGTSFPDEEMTFRTSSYQARARARAWLVDISFNY